MTKFACRSAAVASALALLLLLVPVTRAEETITVRPGDTLSGLSARYDVSESAILRANPDVKDPNLLRVGDRLVIPTAGLSPTPAAPRPTTVARSALTASSGSVLDDTLLVTWYGNPHTGLMGVLGQFTGDDLAARLRRQANAYGQLTGKRVQPAYHLVAVVAQGSAGLDGKWRRRESKDIIDSMLEQARAHGFKLILDAQVGHSTVQDELEYLRPWLEEPDVYLALDPEFDMWEDQEPGEEIGHTVSQEVNYALGMLNRIVAEKGLPPKVLLLHQFTMNMLPDKENIGPSPNVDLVLDMDGFGAQWLKLDTYRAVMNQGQLEYAGIKLFYDQDPGPFTPEQVMNLDPVPSVVIYQ